MAKRRIGQKPPSGAQTVFGYFAKPLIARLPRGLESEQ